MRIPGFCGSSYATRSRNAHVERCMNLYVERSGSSTATKAGPKLLHTPGFDLFASVPEAPIRGLFAQDGRCFCVAGQTLYELAADGTATSRGSVLFDEYPVTFSSNGDGGSQLFITAGDHGHIFDLNTLSLTDETSGARFGGYIRSYFVRLDTATSTIAASDLLDGTTWPGASVGQRTLGSDRFKSMIIGRDEVWFLGSKSSEIWNVVDSAFPLEPIPGAVIQYGIVAPFSAIRVGNTPIWLGGNEGGEGIVLAGVDFSAQRISNHGLESAISRYIEQSTIEDALAFTYMQDGHSFYLLTFPTAEATWVYDLSTQEWHERGYWDVETAEYKASRAMHHCVFNGKHLVGDRLLGRIYEQSLTTYTDVDGAAIRRSRRVPHVDSELRGIIYNHIQVDIETGVGLVDGQGSDPMAMLLISGDGGRTYTEQPFAGFGKAGEYGPMLEWRRLGLMSNVVIDLVISDPVPVTIADAFMQIKLARF